MSRHLHSSLAESKNEATVINGHRRTCGRASHLAPCVPVSVPFLTAVMDDKIIARESTRYVALDAIPFRPGVEMCLDDSLVTVVISNDCTNISSTWIDDCLARMESCDVYQRRHFFDGLVIIVVKPGHVVAPDFREHIQKLGIRWLDIRHDKELASGLTSGPYMFSNNTLKPIHRLYDDTQRAFLTAIKPISTRSNDSAFSQLKAAGTMYDCLAVAVPSRAAEIVNCGPRRLRIAVKDVYRLKGLKTSLNNFAYYEMNKQATSTAAVVESLSRQGAHILGLTKLSSMIAREEPMDAVEFHTAFNPRGDGYQSPAGSSSGSAAAVASYDWLDCALGTDTSGSGRRPAMVNGVWQYRPSHDPANLAGMVETYLRFDAPCVFSRNFHDLETVARSWVHMTDSTPASHRAYEILWPQDYLPVGNQAQMALINDFVDDMKTHLGASVTNISIKQAWKESHPDGVSEDLELYLEGVITKTYYYAFYHSTDDFREYYAESHGGKPPYVIPFVQQRWEKGAAVTKAEHKEATKRLEVYEKWLCSFLFKGRQTQALVVLPVAEAVPNYRDTPSTSPINQSALDELFLPPILGSPDAVVPIGDVPYDSKVTQKVEYLPVVANIVGAPGSDFRLLRSVAKVLNLAKRPTSVLTGPRIFS